MRSSVGVIAAGALAVACGGIAQTGASGTPDTADAGLARSVGGHGGAAQGGQRPASAGGSGGAPSCVETHEAVMISAYEATFAPMDAGPAADAELFLDDSISDISADRFVLGPWVIGIDAPGLDLTRVLHFGAFAHVHYVGPRCATGSCKNAILVTSLPTWQGQANPFPSRSGLYVAADNGGVMASDAPFTVEHVPVPGCTGPTGGCTGEPAGPYLLRFTAPQPGARIDVPMGAAEWFPVNAGGLMAHDARSFVSSTCDGDPDFAYWVTDGAPPP